MKAISLRPDYAFAVLAGEKTTEYRSWDTKHRGDLLICSTAKRMKGTIPGHALVVCTITDTKKISERQYAWQLDNFRTIVPFPVKGQQGFYNVSDKLINYFDDSNITDDEIDTFIGKSILPLII